MLLFCAANLRCDNGKGGDNNHRDGRPADNRRALLEHRLEAERRADRRNAKQNRRDDKASELRVPDKREQRIKPDIARMCKNIRASQNRKRHQNDIQPLQPFHAETVENSHDGQ